MNVLASILDVGPTITEQQFLLGKINHRLKMSKSTFNIVPVYLVDFAGDFGK
jgi:hypothetical protein